MSIAFLGGLGPAAAKAAGKVAVRFGQGFADRRRRELAAAEASRAILGGDAAAYLNGLRPGQIHALAELFAGPRFADLVQQAAVLTLLPADQETVPRLREQVRLVLGPLAAFDDAGRYEATDLVVRLIETALLAVRRELPVLGEAPSLSLKVAADVAAASVRNGVVLSQLADLDEVYRFAEGLRGVIARTTAEIRVSHAGRTRVAGYDQLYVTPLLRSLDLVYGEQLDTLPGLLGTNARLLVLGDPGAGKSTLAAKLQHDLAADVLADLEGLVPLLLVVRDHVRGLRDDHQTLLHYLEAVCRRPGNWEPPPGAVEYLLLNGRAMVIIDGLDELGEGHYRTRFAHLVDAFAHRYPLARIVVTSRVVGYHAAPLDEAQFPGRQLAPFTVEQVGQYADAFFALDGEPDAHRRRREAFMAESATADDLRTNPLMLSLLCTLYTSINYIPRNRPELYEKCAELLFETWDRSRGIDVPHRYAAHVKPAVQRLAWQLFTDPERRQAIPRSELVAELARYLKDRRFPDDAEATQAAEDFLAFCTGRAWVLTDVGSDRLQPRYGFVHRTFLEYFAATQLVKQDPTPAGVWRHLGPRVGEGSWAVVAELAVQILDRAFDEGADRLFGLALEQADQGYAAALAGDRWGVDAAVTSMTFCLGCLEATAPGNEALERIVERCVRWAAAVPLARRRGLGEVAALSQQLDLPLAQLLGLGAPDNADRLVRLLEERLVRAPDGPDQPSLPILRAAALGERNRFLRLRDRSVQAALQAVGRDTEPPVPWVWYPPERDVTVEDIDRAGVVGLFYSYACSGERVDARARDYIARAVAPGSAQSLYQPRHRGGQIVVSTDPLVAGHLERIRPAVIRGYAAFARAIQVVPSRAAMLWRVLDNCEPKLAAVRRFSAGALDCLVLLVVPAALLGWYDGVTGYHDVSVEGGRAWFRSWLAGADLPPDVRAVLTAWTGVA